ncbi:homocysteine S-methyltransferase [Blastococcus sp. BMG 814]|uniref:Homocysteine S-methyltransferase n=1 Tax=Blastococcus carthaginiensis TaxID=3050034 RepID=A0ABT9ID07_9ACTN|nr:homocysteine S-methyltransferase [Blastococcus carthaginiensis]MDP5183042.1 homocysteine S-methyltransferase [Blastococcus carthaginiensis]
MPDLAAALAAGPVVLDGGLSTELEARGHDVSSALWSARLLRDDPAAVVAAHAAFAAAGAQVATTASYQATVEGFAAAGVGAAEARRLIASSVALAREGQGEGWVAGSVGPYGAMLADGSEYTGAYADPVGVAALRAFHRPRMELLAEAGADVLACETVPAAAEAEALLLEAQALGVPVWLSLTTVVDDDGVVRTRRGEPASEVFAMAADVDAVIAVGVNCTAPTAVGPAVTQASRTGKPVVVYPNSGEGWDAVARGWTGSPGIAPDAVPGWIADGARLVGGCCRVRPQHVAGLARALP